MLSLPESEWIVLQSLIVSGGRHTYSFRLQQVSEQKENLSRCIIEEFVDAEESQTCLGSLKKPARDPADLHSARNWLEESVWGPIQQSHAPVRSDSSTSALHAMSCNCSISSAVSWLLYLLALPGPRVHPGFEIHAPSESSITLTARRGLQLRSHRRAAILLTLQLIFQKSYDSVEELDLMFEVFKMFKWIIQHCSLAVTDSIWRQHGSSGS